MWYRDKYTGEYWVDGQWVDDIDEYEDKVADMAIAEWKDRRNDECTMSSSC